MRAFLDIVENLTSTVRFVFGMITLGIMTVGLMISVGASFLLPKAVDSIGERAERVGERAINAELEARRAKELAKDGWGYRSQGKDSATAPRDSESAKNGWGD